MIYSIENINKLLNQIPDFIKKSFENENKTLRLYDLLSWYYSQSMKTSNLFGVWIMEISKEQLVSLCEQSFNEGQEEGFDLAIEMISNSLNQFKGFLKDKKLENK